jgi:hypothetical protein
MKRGKKRFSTKRGNKILHGCLICGVKTYLSPFLTHKGHNFCGCGETLSQITKNELKGEILW